MPLRADSSAMSPGPAKNTYAIFIALASLFSTLLLVMIGYFWVDRPVARFVNESLHWPNHHGVVATLPYISDPLIPISIVVFVTLGFLAFIGHVFSKHPTAALLCSISIIVSATIKDELKLVFGRTWPDTWINDNPSFLHGGVYGFNFMHGGTSYQSFPSGHMTAICAGASVLWILYPRFRWAWVLAALAIGTLLVGANYHFLSDVIAGAFVGISTGGIVVAIWQQGSA